VTRILLATLLGLLAAAPAWCVEVLVRPAEGREVKGRLMSVKGEELRVHVGTGAQVFKLADLMSAEMVGVRPPDGAGCARIRTVSGDLIPAKISTGEGRLYASGPWVERFEVNTRNVSALLLPQGLKDQRAREAFLSGQRRKSDHLYLLNDDFEGMFEGLTLKGISFKSFLGKQEYKLEDVAAIVFAELKRFEPPQSTYLTAELAGGGRIHGVPGGISGETLSWKTLGGMQLKLKLSTVKALRVVNGRVVFLDALDPQKVEQQPFIHGLPFIWKWQRNRDVFRKPLKLGGKSFSRGLGVAARTRLTYHLDGRFKRFKAAAGICDSVASGGRTAFKVLVDGKARFDNSQNPLSGGKPPRRVDVDVTGAKVIVLVVDFGPDGSDLGDIGGWGEARLVK
jgi:hypothetical protein